jgi:hypothetical protein
MWYNKVVEDLGQIPVAVSFFEKELTDAFKETKLVGSLEKNAQDLSGITSHRFSQLQEVEAILKFLNIKYDKIRSDHYRKYLERYQRELSDRSIEKYIDGEQDVISMLTIINEISLIRNQYLSIMKGLDVKNWQISNITKLRVVGLENSLLDTDKNN